MLCPTAKWMETPHFFGRAFWAIWVTSVSVLKALRCGFVLVCLPAPWVPWEMQRVNVCVHLAITRYYSISFSFQHILRSPYGKVWGTPTSRFITFEFYLSPSSKQHIEIVEIEVRIKHYSWSRFTLPTFFPPPYRLSASWSQWKPAEDIWLLWRKRQWIPFLFSTL